MVRTGNFLVLIFSLCIFSWSVVVAKDLNVTATVDRTKMSENDTFTLQISVSSEESINVSQPRLPDLKDFELLNTWKSSKSQSTFVNGQFQVQRTQSFNYMLAPLKDGQLTIGSSQVRVDGKTFNTKPISVQVIAGGGSNTPQNRQKNQRQRPQQDPFNKMEDMFSQLLQRRGMPGFRTQPNNLEEAFFIQLELDKKKAYAGEQITASWYIYTQGQIRDIDTLKYPSLNGFWKEDIEIATRLNFRNEVVNGQVFKKALLVSYALFPIKPGQPTIDPYKAKCTVLSPTRFGFTKPRKYTKASQEVKVEVMRLPDQGKPQDFNGAVGRFNLTADLVSNEVPANQPVTLKVRFDGRGNAKVIDLPPLDLPQSVEVYDTQKQSKFYRNGKSYKEFEVILIPREPGEFVIPGLSVAMFDPVKEEYYREETQQVALKVVPSAGNEVLPSNPMDIKKPETQEKEGPQMPGPVLTWKSGSGWWQEKRALVWGGVFLLAFMGLLLKSRTELGWGQTRRDLLEDLSMRNRRLRKLADQGDWRAVGAEGTNLVYHTLGALTDKGSDAQLSELFKKAPPSVRREIEEPLKPLMDKLEKLGFAPEEVIGDLNSTKNMKQLIQQLDKLMRQAVRKGLEGESGQTL